MAYKELIKNFAHIRGYMRRFYVYGFKSRSDFDSKSLRSYDDEKRRIESWLGDYMGFHRSEEGKNVFLSIDSRATAHNPLYKAFKSKSFTDKDITLHFIIFDILHSPDISLPLKEIINIIETDYLSGFENPISFDESTLRKKLKEYISMGLIATDGKGKNLTYRKQQDSPMKNIGNLLDFYSEVSPCGVIGSFILDRGKKRQSDFTFKHHYITGALDSRILYRLFKAMGEKRKIALTHTGKNGRAQTEKTHLTPLKIYISRQNGRQYLMAAKSDKSITAYRLDYINSITVGDVDENFDSLREKLEEIRPFIWGANINPGGKTERVEFSVAFSDKEEHIYQRLLREKRGGTVIRTGPNSATFCANVFDSREMVPWIRSFICRITHIDFSDKELEKSFKSDLYAMYSLYGLEK